MYEEAIELLLQNTTRTIVSIAHNFNRHHEESKTAIVSPFVRHIFWTAQRYLRTTTNFQDHRWLEDFDQLKRTLSLVNQRWRYAGNTQTMVEVSDEANFYRYGTASSDSGV